MNKKIVIRVILPVLIIAEIGFLFLTCKSYSNKDVKEIKETYKVDKTMFSMYKENESTGKYEKVTDSSYFPSSGYKLNFEKSVCVDSAGETIEGILSGVGNKVTVKSNKTAFCDLYFDRMASIYELCKDSTNLEVCFNNEEENVDDLSDVWDSPLEGDGFRYVGEDPDNYICFGTDDLEECTANPGKFMYRIIGIFDDAEGKPHLKLIKKEALNTAYAWHSDDSTDTAWGSSALYTGLNETYFVTNTDYSYMQTSDWFYLIDDWNYTAVNTLTEESSGPNYYQSTSQDVYYHEMNSDNKTSTVGEWTTVTSKIGLMYASDYLLSLGEMALNLTASEDYTTLNRSWMFLDNNDDEPAGDYYEWTMARAGYIGGEYYAALEVDNNGRIIDEDDSATMSVRPVFYLNSDVIIKGGDGKIGNPYILNPSGGCSEYSNAAECLINTSDDLWTENRLIGDGYRYIGTNPNNYICFGTTAQETCKNSHDGYMFRIIGIFADSDGNYHLKLIKKNAINSARVWHEKISPDYGWASSSSKTSLNGSGYLTGSVSMNGTWPDKIVKWTYRPISTYYYTKHGLNYGLNTVETVYYHEKQSNLSGRTCYHSSVTADCTIGTLGTANVKIGLMYVRDYLLSLGPSALGYKSSEDYAKLKKGWMHLSNNDPDPVSDIEWTIARSGLASDTYNYAETVAANGKIPLQLVYNKYSMRPVFYLTSDTQISMGTGTVDDPYIIIP